MRMGRTLKSENVYMKWFVWWGALLLLYFAPQPAWARGGGGCLAEGTMILTPGRAVAIEKLKVGDLIWSVVDGRLQRAEVQALTVVQPEEYLEISTGSARLEVTPEHPMMVARGEFRLAGRLRANDTVYLLRDGRLDAATVHFVHRVQAMRPAYNLLVNPGGTFVSGGFLVHNKGCFLPESPVLRADGKELPISAVRPGDQVMAFTAEGRMVCTTVRSVISREVEEFTLLRTDQQTLRVTADHPFYVGCGTFKTLEVLRVGDTILAWDGGTLSEQQIVSLQRIHEHVQVFNLQTDQPHTFFAGGLAVHNKGGCFPRGTRITTPRGTVAIEVLTTGDEVWGINRDGLLVRAHVEAAFVARNSVLRVETDRGVFSPTKEHPIGLWEGGFRQAGELRAGDRIRQLVDGRFVASTVRRVLPATKEELVFNLQVSEPHTFLAENIIVHNKGGGCFPPGTPIRTPQGRTPIERLSAGEAVLGIDPEGRIVRARVESVFATRALVLAVETDRGPLDTTMDHPVGLPGGGFIPAGELRPGQKILMWDDGHMGTATVLQASLERHEQEVYNLSVEWPNTFLAAGFLVHNKGGSSFRSGSSSRRSSGSSGDSVGVVIVVIIIMAVFVMLIIVLSKRNRGRKSENLDFIYGHNKIAPKAAKTEKLLLFISQQDPSVSPEELQKLAESTFRKLQECWQGREYGPMKSLLMPDLFNQHIGQIHGLVRNHEINRIENLKVERVDLVNVRYTEKLDQREFTALITASARDYYEDDRTGKFLRGDDASARFQEFWTFHRFGDRWLLREIEQAGESDILKDENFAEMLTDDTIKGIYGEVARKKGETGPWLEEPPL